MQYTKTRRKSHVMAEVASGSSQSLMSKHQLRIGCYTINLGTGRGQRLHAVTYMKWGRRGQNKFDTLLDANYGEQSMIGQVGLKP